MIVALALGLAAPVAQAEEPARELPWRRVHGEMAASFWVGRSADSVYGMGTALGLRASVGVAITRNIDVNASFRFVSIDAGNAKALNEIGAGVRYLIPRGSLVYFGDFQLGFVDMRSNDNAFVSFERSKLPSPELSAGIAYELSQDASMAGLVGGGLELIATEDGTETEPYATVQFALIAHFGDDD